MKDYNLSFSTHHISEFQINTYEGVKQNPYSLLKEQSRCGDLLFSY